MSIFEDQSYQAILFGSAAANLMLYAVLCVCANLMWRSDKADILVLPLGSYVPKWFRLIAWSVIGLFVGSFACLIKNTQYNGLQI